MLWHQYIEPYSRIEILMKRELDICKEEFLNSEPDIFSNPYVKTLSNKFILERMSKLRTIAAKTNNAYYTDIAIHICFGIHDKDGNYSVWAGATMQSIVENTKVPRLSPRKGIDILIKSVIKAHEINQTRKRVTGLEIRQREFPFR